MRRTVGANSQMQNAMTGVRDMNARDKIMRMMDATTYHNSRRYIGAIEDRVSEDTNEHRSLPAINSRENGEETQARVLMRNN